MRNQPTTGEGMDQKSDKQSRGFNQQGSKIAKQVKRLKGGAHMLKGANAPKV